MCKSCKISGHLDVADSASSTGPEVRGATAECCRHTPSSRFLNQGQYYKIEIGETSRNNIIISRAFLQYEFPKIYLAAQFCGFFSQLCYIHLIS